VTTAVFFIFGTLIGSFLNVVILRYNTGKNIFAPGERSECFTCAKKLVWFELVPVLSFAALRGRCSGCKSPISWQYPFVELATGALFVGIVAKLGMPLFALVPSVVLLAVMYAAVWCLLVVIAVYDMRHKIIPDGIVYAFSAISFVSIFVPGSVAYEAGVISGLGPWSGILAGAIFFSFLGGLWYVSGGKWLGFGDAKLILGVGFLLGLSGGLSAFALSFWIGAAVTLLLLAIGAVARRAGKVVRRSRLLRFLGTLTMKSEIPFAPFIIIGALIVFFCSVDVFGAVQAMSFL
jgi:prepilin signal peptidase PulO-like enzyme (type II secretory pathway)